MRRCGALLVMIGGLLGVWGEASSLVAQQPDPKEQLPRFLLASTHRALPMVVDAGSVPVLRRRISVSLDGVTLDEALKTIASEGHIQLNYSRDIVPLFRRVRLKADDLTVAAALTEILLGTSVDVLIGKNGHIALVRHVEAVVRVEGGSIVGRILDAKTGQPLGNTDVLLSDSRWRTTTDTNGWYRLSDIMAGRYTLTARRLGYVKQSRQVIVESEKEDTVDLALEAAAVALDELITTATGQQRRRDIGNAITTIHADSVLQAAPIRNLTDMLEGRVPGLNVQHTSGAPGDPARLRLRGVSSVMRGNDPVVVVDGVRIYSAQSEARSGNLTNLAPKSFFTNQQASLRDTDVPAPSPLDQIDPNTIEKIEVFKGPSAATLYGADAANGVIVVTTKKGKAGPVRWNARTSHGRTSMPGRYRDGYYLWGHDLLDGQQRFCTLTSSRCVSDSLTRFQALNEDDLTILGRGQATTVSLSASGGVQSLTYSITGSYNEDIGLLTLPDMEVERFRTRFNREVPKWMQRPHQLTAWSVQSNMSARLGATADITLSSTLSRTDQARTSLERQVAALSGTYVDRVNGTYYRPGSRYVLAATPDVLQGYFTQRTASSFRFATALSTTWQPRTWFNASARAGLEVQPRSDQAYLPAGIVSLTDSGAVIEATGRSLLSTVNVQGAAWKSLGWGFLFETRVGANLQTTTTNDLATSAAALLPGTRGIGGARQISATNFAARSSIFGWYIEPTIRGQRLSLSTGLRLDGGSTYGARVTNLLKLPKLNGSWVISEEPWFPASQLISSLRLRGAYGQAQVQPGITDRLRLYRRRNGVGGSDWLKLTTLGNTQLRPERSTEFEGGFDADLFDSRVTLEATAYRKMQVDALMPTLLPVSVNGGGTVIRNIGNILNRGVELTAGVTPIQLPAITWNMQFNYTHNHNELTKLGQGVQSNPRQGIVEGYPVSSRWGRPILGYGDVDGSGFLDAAEVVLGDSLVYLGRLNPRHEMSLHTNIALFNGAVSVASMFNYETGGTQVDETARTNWVLARALIDASAPFQEQAAVLMYDSTAYGVTQDISTLRFNSLSINYRVPDTISRLLRAERMTVSLQGSNLWLRSTYRGKDPDVSAWSPSESIIDTGQLPRARLWQLAVFLAY